MFLNKDMEKKYVIINKEMIGAIDFKLVIETSASTLRYSLDGSQTIIKFIGEIPSFLDGEKIYSHNEIIKTINNPENGWININE